MAYYHFGESVCLGMGIQVGWVVLILIIIIAMVYAIIVFWRRSRYTNNYNRWVSNRVNNKIIH